MLALLAVPVVMSMVLTSTESSANAAGKGFQATLDLPAWAYTVSGAVVFLALLGVTLAFSGTGKRH